MIRSIFLTAVAASAMAMMVGCEGKGDKVSGVAPEARQAISAAATARYPGNPTTSRDVQAAAINYPEKKFVNFLRRTVSTRTAQSSVVLQPRLSKATQLTKMQLCSSLQLWTTTFQNQLVTSTSHS